MVPKWKIAVAAAVAGGGALVATGGIALASASPAPAPPAGTPAQPAQPAQPPADQGRDGGAPSERSPEDCPWKDKADPASAV